MDFPSSIKDIGEREVLLNTLNNMQHQVELMKQLIQNSNISSDGTHRSKSPTMLKKLSQSIEIHEIANLPRNDLINMLTTKIIESNNQSIHNNLQNEIVKKKQKLSVDLTPTKMDIFRIVLTGGPCAGKTTALTKVADQLRERGYAVFLIPEAATMIFQSGGCLNFASFTDEMIKKFQYYLLMLQMTMEDSLAGVASASGADKIVILCDRGSMDGRAYISKKLWDELMSENDLSYHKIRDLRYDLIIHISSAANGAEEYYTLTNNKARGELLDQARSLDKALEEAWLDHPNFIQINNGFKSFDEKMDAVANTVFRFLHIPVSANFYKKYLIANPDQQLLQLLEQNPELKIHKFEIRDIIFYKEGLSGAGPELTYFRKRVS